jgi:hypothetical protein
MSALFLQRFVVRILSDPPLLERIRTQPESVYGIESITPAERNSLCEADPRAYRTDPHLSARFLRALLEENLLSAHLASPGKPGLLMGYFPHPQFHGDVHHWRSLREGFQAYLRTLLPEHLLAYLDLEAALSQAREDRVKRIPKGEKSLWLRPGNVLFEGPVDLADSYAEAVEELGLHGPEAAARLLDAPSLTPVPFNSATTWFLVEPDEAGELSVGAIPAGLASLLAKARNGIPEENFIQSGLELGIETKEEVKELVDSLLEEGLLMTSH